MCLLVVLSLTFGTTGCSASRPQTVVLMAESASASQEVEPQQAEESPAEESLNDTPYYEQIYQAALGEQKSITLKGVSFDEIRPVLEDILEQPELFWLSGYETETLTVGNVLQSVTIDFRWCYEEIGQRRHELAGVVEQFLSTVPADATDYQKSKLVHDYLVKHITYGNVEGQNIYAALVEGRCVCNGYAKAYCYLMRKLGVACDKINGTAGGQSHAWNVVTLEGVTCYTDVTWDDLDSFDASGNEYVSYQWLNVAREDIARSHQAEQKEQQEQADDNSRAMTYFVQEDAWLESYTKGAVLEIFQRQKESTLFTLRCSNQQCYEQALTQLIDKQEIYSILKGVGCQTSAISYWTGELYTISISPK